MGGQRDTYLGRYFVSKQPSCASRRHGPGIDVFRVTPNKVTKGSLVGNLLGARNDADLVQGADFRAQATVHTEHLSIDNGGQREEVEDLAAGFPDGGVSIFCLAFFVEAIDLGDLPGFVVSSNKGDSVGKSRPVG